MKGRCYAHTLPGRPEAEWQDLFCHLENVSQHAAASGACFDAGDWARVAGLWHDLGKYSDAFQDYLRTASVADPHNADAVARTDHSTAGAQHAVENIDVLGHLLAYPIAGHHSGLLDGRGSGACLAMRLTKPVEPWRGSVPSNLVVPPDLSLPDFVREALVRGDPFCIGFFVRMIFSCLVDADFLDTENFMSRDQAAARPSWPRHMIEQMEGALTRHIGRLDCESSYVNIERAKVRQDCLVAAEHPPGLYSLTVPTGGGKTLSSLAFALRHARRHHLRRVIYVIPFTSIIEQTAEVFRAAMLSRDDQEPDPVIEHHSNLDAGKETVASRLAAENWDAPLVVTTSVQFYESLFAAQTSRCRKLHNIAKAVIVLDEVQTLPVDYLKPCLQALRELATNYGSTVVLCTATQPAIQRRRDFRIGLDDVREIGNDHAGLYERLKRVKVNDLGQVSDVSLSHQLAQEEQVLCIVNTRRHALRLFEAIGANRAGHFHLSALMCPEHRTQMLNRIRAELAAGQICRVISTQLVEAGVDLDFPAVYRSLAGVDSIAQAAGRCNRNGRSKSGRTRVFRSEHGSAERFVSETANCASQVLPMHDDPLSLEAVEHYFRLYYWEQSSRWDRHGILGEFHLNQDPSLPFLFGFSTVADRFKLIEDQGKPVIIPWGRKGRERCASLRDSWELPSGQWLRLLQRYTVQVPSRLWTEHVGRGTIELVHNRYPVLASPELYYSEQTGLDLDRDVTESLVV